MPHINHPIDDPAADSPPLKQLVQLAAVLANPVQFFHADHVAAVSGLDDAQLKGLCRVPGINKAMNTAIAGHLGTPTLDLHPTAATRDACDLVIAPLDIIEGFLRQVTAVKLQHAVRNCVLKTDRERVAAILGDAAYNTALREAPFFYAEMADPSLQNYFAGDPDADHPTLGMGASLVHRYLHDVDTGLAQIFAWRLPQSFISGHPPLEAAQQRAFQRLLAAKGPQAAMGRA
ncbi:hypothetical protein [Yoonia sp. BS5-3]|uniref:Uncharacterized protein n=1 Tax=Yoonia phaeophyticola TaxID=3137369 RepID=A0ABZ2V5L0_9RHOB